MRNVQFGNQINLYHANPTLTESYGDWEILRSPLLEATRGKKSMGLEHSSQPLPAATTLGLMRLVDTIRAN